MNFIIFEKVFIFVVEIDKIILFMIKYECFVLLKEFYDMIINFIVIYFI